jgi:glycerophosphoryl diester phosphodiesterase
VQRGGLAALVALGGCEATAATETTSSAAPSLRLTAPPTLTPDFFGDRAVQLAVAVDGAAAGPSGRSLAWRVADTAIAVVDADGYLQARRVGQTTVWVQASTARGPLVDSARVTVGPAPDSAVAVIAHRAYALVAPENTLPAIDSAYARGADAVEIDIHLTRDGVPVVIHDYTVDRTTSGRGAVASLTAAELRALDACSWFGRGWAPCQVPTLDEVLAAAARRGGRLIVDIKAPLTPDQLRDLARQVRASSARHRVMFIDTDYARLSVIRAADPGVPLGYLSYAFVGAEQLDRLGGTAALYNKAAVTTAADARAHVAQLRARGITAGAWTIVTAGEALALVRAGVTRIITDVPLDARDLTLRR